MGNVSMPKLMMIVISLLRFHLRTPKRICWVAQMKTAIDPMSYSISMMPRPNFIPDLSS